MYNYIKYEIKGSYKFILGVLSLIILLTFGVYSTIISSIKTTELDPSHIGFLTISILIIVAAFFATFLYIVNLFRKELYEDTGYLTFTIPLTGRQILASKLFTAMIFYISIGLIALLTNFIGISKIAKLEGESFPRLSEVFSLKYVIFYILFINLSLVLKLLTVYFSMALNRMAFRTKKFKGGWFVLFLVLSIIISFLQINVMEKYPYYIDAKTGKIESIEIDFLDKLFSGARTEDEDSIDYIDTSFVTNKTRTKNIGNENNEVEIYENLNVNENLERNSVSAFIFNLLLSTLLFLITAYILENKINI